MTPEQRDQIIDAAVRLYPTEQRPSLDMVAAAAGVPAIAIRRSYKGFGEILDDYFARCLERRNELLSEVPDVESMPLEERVGTYLFMLLDLFEADGDFAPRTFAKRAGRWGSPFRTLLDQDVAALLESTDVPGVNRFALTWMPIRAVLVEALVDTIELWLADESPERERATALVDRLVAFCAELATSRGLERGLDIARYAAGAGYIPFVGGWYDQRKA
jgi:AcrR family transcriptional regulator